ncbi:helix-turn-helix domain-containing protein [uncultured Acidaminococcus sp.]|uniref:helix-turn-helix domain-containing protein n=1 Tax=uncultured Acidaminococcus sp. TaxID=352152 RepID=UPI00259AA1F8|nr:helix-turn-helix transcriptional regulator [uncultured Acidaminococcus sp.]
MDTIGARIRECRKREGISAEELAKKLGKNKATVYRYENDDIKDLPITILEPLARALNTTPAYLLGWDKEKNNGLSSKEEREIESDLEDMMNSVSSAAYDSDSDMEDLEAFKATIKAAMIQAKKIAKKKYTPKKYRKE